MPGNARLQRKQLADTETTNLTRRDDGNDVSGNCAMLGISKSTAAAGDAENSVAISLPNGLGPDAPDDGEIARITTSAKASQTAKDLLQVPDTEPPPRRPIETSIWDWDTPLGSVGQSSPYYYEPQGELLLDQREATRSKTEFNVPQPVPGSGINWPFSTESGHTSNNGFAAPRRPIPTTGGSLKRKPASDENSLTNNHSDNKRVSHTMSESGEDPNSPEDNRPTSRSARAQSGAAASTRGRSGTDAAESRPRPSGDLELLRPPGISSSTSRRTPSDPKTPMVLPPRKVFPIQIGDKLFRLSGASISSDAPSYFSQFFEEQLRQNEGADNVRTLYIDRDPSTFEDISLHLQGYHIEPKDGPHFVKLFADAQFFSLPRLTQQLFTSTIYVRIGDSEFQIPRDIFNNPGDSPNYFSLGFAAFFSTPSDAFPGLSQRALLRPPSILPPSVPNRSAKTFADLLHILRGYPLEIRSGEHRQELLRDARYYHLKGLEQRLIPHSITYNLARKKSEILIRLDDIRQSGISFVSDSTTGTGSSPSSPASSTASNTPNGPGWIHYQRPYVDSEASVLIVEVGGDENTVLTVGPGSSASPARLARATFHGIILTRITKLFSVIANKMNLPTTQPLGIMMMERGAGVASLPVSPRNTGVSDERVKVRIGPDADVTVDGRNWLVGKDCERASDSESPMEMSSDDGKRAQKRQPQQRQDEEEEWILQKAQWRLRVQPVSGGAQNGRSGVEVVLGAVKIQAYRTEKGRNRIRGFLT